MDWTKIGARLKAVRKAKGKTQLYVAEHCDVTDAHISLVESGQSGASLEVLEGYAEALGGELLITMINLDPDEENALGHLRAAWPHMSDTARKALIAGFLEWEAAAATTA